MSNKKAKNKKSKKFPSDLLVQNDGGNTLIYFGCVRDNLENMDVADGEEVGCSISSPACSRSKRQ